MASTIIKAVMAAALLALPSVGGAKNLVILHTNDTHSQVDPVESDGLGGAGRRMVVVDSVRCANENVLLIDAGDAVQGTLYFNLYGGEVEQKLMNAMGYDVRILGNHDFDNGVDSLAAVLAKADAEFLATNYDLSNSALAGKFKKYAIKEFDGRRIGFIAINLRPEGMIAEGNYDGVEYLDAVEAANASAWWLRHVGGCDLVVAISHIGYNPSTPPGDLLLARASKDIDIIIGGHSHDLITPTSKKYQCLVANADGRDVLVAQVGKAGKNVGEITIDLESLRSTYRVIPVNSRLDARVPQEFAALVAPYRAGVDSLMTNAPVGKTRIELPQESAALLNWATDVILDRGRQLADSVDFAILNKGGLRRGLPKGTIHEGQIITMMPFNNRVQVIDIKGSELLAAFNVMATVDGNGVSEGVEIVYVPGTEAASRKDAYVTSAKLNGRPIEAERIYRVATIDYIANGGDYMSSMRNHKLVAQSNTVVFDDVLEYLRHGNGRKRKINPSTAARMHN